MVSMTITMIAYAYVCSEEDIVMWCVGWMVKGKARQDRVGG
jgi:hypothetical protein